MKFKKSSQKNKVNKNLGIDIEFPKFATVSRKHEDSDVRHRDSFLFYIAVEFNIIYIMAYMSQEGYDQMVAQLRKMELVDRPAASAAIAEARDKGDLSENSEYDAAKEAQAMLEAKINKLKMTLANAKIIDTSKLAKDSVQILATVEMENVKTGAKMTYTIVSESEANLREGKISSTTPIAQGLLGKKVGDIAKITVPRGEMELKITNISYN